MSLQTISTSEICTGIGRVFFFGTLAITWDDIRAHSIGSLIAFDEACFEHELEVQAQILKPKDSLTSPPQVAHIPSRSLPLDSYPRTDINDTF